MASDSEKAFANMAVRERGIPAVPRSASGEMQTMLTALKEQVERLSSGTRDTDDNRAVRIGELKSGILNEYFSANTDTEKTVTPGTGGSRILKAPRNLQYTNLIFAIRLTWENVETDYSHVEVYCAENSSLLDDAQKVGIATKPMAEWTHFGLSTKVNYSYWIRAVGWDGAVSPWAPPQGALIVPANDDTSITEILDILTGTITEDQLYTALNTRLDGIEDNAAAIQVVQSITQALGAMWYLKTQVNGYISGFGLYNSGTTSEFIILADKFMVVTPGKNPKVPFVVGSVNGVSTVGIDGNLVVDGTIKTRMLEAGSVVADKISAFAIGGRHIAAAIAMFINNGGKLTVGQNNIILDSATDSIIVAPDNGTIHTETDGSTTCTPDFTGKDYCKLTQGNIYFKLWLNDLGTHAEYLALQRSEGGTANSGTTVQIPGYFKNQPKIIVAPLSVGAYAPEYANQAQRVEAYAESVTQFSSGRWSFVPRIQHKAASGVKSIVVNTALGAPAIPMYSTSISEMSTRWVIDVNPPYLNYPFFFRIGGSGSCAVSFSLGKNVTLPPYISDSTVFCYLRTLFSDTIKYTSTVTYGDVRNRRLIYSNFSFSGEGILSFEVKPVWPASADDGAETSGEILGGYNLKIGTIQLTYSSDVVASNGSVLWLATGL